MRTRTLATLALATTATLLLLSVLAPTAAARPPPAACADVGRLYVAWGDIGCGNNEVCYTLAEGHPSTCYDLTVTLA